MSYFAMGAYHHYKFDWFRARAGTLAILGLACFGLSKIPQLAYLEAVGLAFVMLYLAYGMPYVGAILHRQDLSYGVYIYHWPIIQVLLALGAFASPWRGFGLTLALTAAFAALSWNLVERRFLQARLIRPAPLGRVDEQRQAA
jgi:peptidoglycan/LPS O-acetylase OafA/YrhL